MRVCVCGVVGMVVVVVLVAGMELFLCVLGSYKNVIMHSEINKA